MNTTELFRKTVYDSNAEKVGKVIDIMFELPPGDITHIVVRSGLVAKQSIPVAAISKVADSIILNVPRSALK